MMPICLRSDLDAASLRQAAKESADDNQVRRLLALAAIYDGASRAEAAAIGGVTRQIVRDWVERLNTGGPDELVARKAPGKSPLLSSDQRAALALGRSGAVGAGTVRPQHLAPDTGPRAARHALSQALGPSAPPRAGPRRGGCFSKDFASLVASIARAHGFRPADIEVWFADQARVGQKNKIIRRWAPRGTRPSAPRDQRTASTYIFGAICSLQGKAAGLVLPWCNTDAMSLHLAEISTRVAPGCHAALIVDQAGWHLSGQLVVPNNITIVPLPAKCPELNPQENIWQFMRDNWLSNRVFTSYTDIVDHCCYAWNKLAQQPWTIMSIGLRDWAHAF